MLAIMAGTSLSCAGTGPLRPVALTGTDGALGPGRGAGVKFSNFAPATGLGSPSIGSTSAVTFLATLTGPGITSSSNTGVWAVRSPYPEAVAVEGDQVPGKSPGVVFDSFYTAPQITDAKFAAFQASMRGPGIDGSNNDALFTEFGGGLHTAVHERVTVAPSTNPPVLFGDALNPNAAPWGSNNWVQSRSGATALRCYVVADIGLYNQHFGVWTDRYGGVEKLYRGGDAVPNSDPQGVFYGAANPRINASGAVITGRLDTTYGGGLWSDRARNGSNQGVPGVGPLHTVVRAGDPAPGTATVFESFSAYSINANGRVAFSASLPTAPTGPGGVWSDGRFGVLQAVMLTGAIAPGTGAAQFALNPAWLVTELAIGDNNVTAVLGHLQQGVANVGGSNDEGIWSNRALSGGNPVGNLRLVVREGAPVPLGLGPDYEGLNFGAIETMWINASGLVGFVCTLNDFTRSIWVENPDGSLSPLVKEFTTIDLHGDGSDIRMIWSLDASPTSGATGDGRRVGLTDSGDIAVRLTFTDDSQGIFTTAALQGCPADFDGSGFVDTDDFDAFVQAFEAGDESADFDRTGFVDTDDFDAFVIAFESGC